MRQSPLRTNPDWADTGNRDNPVVLAFIEKHGRRPRLLDLFSGAGGASMGYYHAGFDEIVGIDIAPQPRYPFNFIQADALHPPVNLHDFDLIHASPPCQRFSRARSFNTIRHHKDWRDYADLLTPCREMLIDAGVPYIMENVPGAPMRTDVMLCGTMFGLKVFRHRLFEISLNMLILTPPCKHDGTVANGDYLCVVDHGGLGMTTTPYARKKACAEAMGIDWMTRKELTQAVPPAYIEFLGKHLIAFLGGDKTG